jgi:hypothetical protein
VAKPRHIVHAPKDGTPVLGIRAGRHIGIVSYDPAAACWENTLDGEGYALLARPFWPTSFLPLPELDPKP